MFFKPQYIKDIGEKLVTEFPAAFTTDFEQNKETVETVTTIDSKTVRNRVAGYTTRLKVQEQQRQLEPEDEE